MPVTLLPAPPPDSKCKMLSTPQLTLLKPRGADYACYTTAIPPPPINNAIYTSSTQSYFRSKKRTFNKIILDNHFLIVLALNHCTERSNISMHMRFHDFLSAHLK